MTSSRSLLSYSDVFTASEFCKSADLGYLGRAIAFMKERVVPVMAVAFEPLNTGKPSSFGCVTCHGPRYETPTKYLSPLTSRADGTLVAFDEQPELARFMADTVVPQVAQALGRKYDSAADPGMGCADCHTIKR